MSNIHELSRDSNGTLINLFIKVGLNIFFLPPLLSIVFVQGCSRVFRKGSLGRTRKAYIFARIESLGTSLSNTLKNEVGHFGLMRFSFVKMLFFLPIGFCSHVDES